MSCKTFNLKSCEIRGATYQGRKIDFVNKVITQDTFTAKVYDEQGYLLTEIIGLKSGSVVYFPFTAIQNLSKDKYRIKYWADFYLLGTIPLGEEELTIGNTCPNCEVDDSTLPFVLELGTETIDFTLQLVYIAIGEGSGGEVDLSEYLKKVDADELYALKNHTHSYNDLTDLPPIESIDNVISIGSIIATENNVLLEVHSSGYNKVYIDKQTYYKDTPDNFSFAPITNGIKVLIIYALPNSQIFYLAEGVEAPETVEPSIPSGSLFVARLIVSTTGVTVESVNSTYKQKQESDWRYVEITSNATPIKLALPFDTRGSFYLTKSAGVGIPTIAGIKKTSITMSGDQYFYGGREGLIFNDTGGDVILNDVGVVDDSVFLISNRITPFTLKNNTGVVWKLRGSVIELLPSGSGDSGGGGAVLPVGLDGQIYEIDNSLPEKIKPSDRLTTVETNKQDKSLFSALADKMVHYYDLATQNMLSTGVEFISAGIMKFKSIILTTNSGTALANELGFDGVNVVFGATKKKLAYKDEIFEHNVRGKRVELLGTGGVNLNIDLSLGNLFAITNSGSGNVPITLINMISVDETAVFNMIVTGNLLTIPSGWVGDSYNDVANASKKRKYIVTIEKGGSSPIISYNLINI